MDTQQVFELALTRDNIQQVVDTSLNQLVVLCFHARAQPDSQTMCSRLGVMARRAQGRFLLATVDCEAEMEIASYFRIQALPTVLLLSQGQPIDGFAGERADADIESMLEKHLPPLWQLKLAEAKALLAKGDAAQQAHDLLKSVYQEVKDAIVALPFADACLLLGDIATAQQLLDTIGLADQDGYFQSLKAKLTLALEAADTPEIRQLQQAFEQNCDDYGVRIELARALVAAHREEEGLALLFEVLGKDLGAHGGQIKQVFMDMLTAMGQGNSLANQYRRKLYSLLY
ncbi:tetratricopeptide repeat protein [Shewanella cyperi]|uniref:Tetratricopeptide repeat protein n=1 Tax=Shewanella cyperi TaxID=2814292 RepID=A0A974XQ29_9GAMM|nr:tetratricopeptide repeat protein [Shewanella cyperi]QSX31313.1 tetratricopeptide repeat protein [Shewanella cyperi]